MIQVTNGYRSLLRLVATGAALSLMAVVFAPAAAAAPAGSVIGTVLAADGEPLEGACVDVGGVSTTTGADGSYAVPIGDGSYVVRFQDCSPVPTHVDLYYPDSPDESGAQQVVVAGAGVDLGGVTLRSGVAVSGTVVDHRGEPAEGVEVGVQGDSSWAWTRTRADGTYRSTPVPDGDYRVSFREAGSATLYWSGAWSWDAASPIALRVADGTERSGIDATLPDWAELTGVVTDAGGEPLAGACVNALLADDGSWIQSASSNPDGSYALTGLPPLELIVRFEDCDERTRITQFYDGVSSEEEATPLTVAPGATTSGIDAELVEGASLSGTVRGPDGELLEGVCVGAVAGDPDAGVPYDGVGGTSTDEDGTYRMGGLPAGPTRVIFNDCGALGPYLDQWWQGADDLGSATPIEVVQGGDVGGIDARFERAAVLSGTVTDTSGDGLEGICVQASDTTQVAGFASTDPDGSYQIALRDGSYVLQYVDCNEEPAYGGTWFGGSLAPSSAEPVAVDTGELVDDLDVQLTEQPPATVVGTVTNVRGEPMAGVCVVLYMADDHVMVTPTDAEGRYEFAAGSGTYVFAYLGCGDESDDDGDVQPYIVDPGTGTAYRATWWGGALLDLDLGNEAPDPIAQGATLITLAPGDNPDRDRCIGCDALDLVLQQDGSSLRATVDPVGLDLSVSGSAAADVQASASLEYQLDCTPASSGAHTQSVLSTTSTSTSFDLEGLQGGTRYECAAAATVGGVLVARSVISVVNVSAAGQVPSSDPSGPAGSTGTGGTVDPVATPRSLAFTG
jgi:protocatechuate 3,4-dioxygenase beta subunit